MPNSWLEPLRTHRDVVSLTSTHRGASCALATIQVADLDPTALRDYLWRQHRIRVRPIAQSGPRGIRISAGLHNTEHEIGRFVDVMTDVIRTGLPS